MQQMHTRDTGSTSDSRLTVATAVFAATELVFKGLFTVTDDATKFIDSVTKQIRHVFGLGTSDIISSTVPARVQELLDSNDTQYYLTVQRQSYASRICAATQCGLPCLLEVSVCLTTTLVSLCHCYCMRWSLFCTVYKLLFIQAYGHADLGVCTYVTYTNRVPLLLVRLH
jgi:hypothetical protein